MDDFIIATSLISIGVACISTFLAFVQIFIILNIEKRWKENQNKVLNHQILREVSEEVIEILRDSDRASKYEYRVRVKEALSTERTAQQGVQQKFDNNAVIKLPNKIKPKVKSVENKINDFIYVYEPVDKEKLISLIKLLNTLHESISKLKSAVEKEVVTNSLINKVGDSQERVRSQLKTILLN